ncbi:MAG: hypothetical protein HN348_12315, partial [Proteobacteria bacterium]|nr:hypothetical protein [Pseudomonadota bacterium]
MGCRLPPISILLVAIAIGCTQDPLEPEGKGPIGWVPPATSGDAKPCAAVDLTGDDLLELEGCVRISPENTKAEVPVHRCGQFNLLGSVNSFTLDGMSSLLYCDSDVDGGMRLAQYQPSTNEVVNTVIEGGCWPDIDSAALLPQDTSAVVAWATFNRDIQIGHLSADGLAGEPVSLTIPEIPTIVDLVDNNPAWLVTNSIEENVWATPLGKDGSPAGDSISVQQGVHTSDAMAFGDGFLLTTCTTNDEILLSAFDFASDKSWEQKLGTLCDHTSRPSMATDGE